MSSKRCQVGASDVPPTPQRMLKKLRENMNPQGCEIGKNDMKLGIQGALLVSAWELGS